MDIFLVTGVTLGFQMDSYVGSEQNMQVAVCVFVYSAGGDAQTRSVSIQLQTVITPDDTATGKISNPHIVISFMVFPIDSIIMYK